MIFADRSGGEIVVAQRRGGDDRPSTLDAIYPTGVIASVVNRQTQVDGGLKVTVCRLQRIGIERLADGNSLAAEVQPIKEQGSQSQKAATLSSAVLDAYHLHRGRFFRDSLRFQSAFQPAFNRRSKPVRRHRRSLLSASVEEKQQLLETRDVATRLERLIDLMSAGRQSRRIIREFLRQDTYTAKRPTQRCHLAAITT